MVARTEPPIGDAALIDCGRCGRYRITTTEQHCIAAVDLAKRLRLSAWLRERTECGGSIPTIDSQWLETLSDIFRELTVMERSDKLLAWLARQTLHPGAQVSLIPDRDFVVAWAQNTRELGYYVSLMEDRDWARRLNPGPQTSGTPWQMEVRPKGFDYLDGRGGPRPGLLVFVARQFSEEVDQLYRSVIAPAIDELGWRPYSVQDDHPGERIDAYIMVKIREARFLVADTTGTRPNVLYEAGYAQGLGKEVIWTAPQAVLDAKDLPFDTRQFRHVPYGSAEQLARGLRAEIEYRIGSGPLKRGQ